MPRSTRIAATMTLATLALGLGACGGGSGGDQTAGEVPGGADAADVEVIDAWAKALNAGDVDAAAAFFALPSVAENGGPTLEIESLDQARLFNSSLPCGAVLVEAKAEGRFTVATFRLTERPGPGDCGPGTDGEAQTAFEIEDGKIVEWRRALPGGGLREAEPAPSSSA